MVSAAARRRHPSSDFALPRTREYPIWTRALARAALSYAARNSTHGSYAAVARAVHRKYPSLGTHPAAKGKGHSRPLSSESKATRAAHRRHAAERSHRATRTHRSWVVVAARSTGVRKGLKPRTARARVLRAPAARSRVRAANQASMRRMSARRILARSGAMRARIQRRARIQQQRIRVIQVQRSMLMRRRR